MERCLVLVALMLSLCMASADDKAALLALKATITSDPFGVLSNWSHQTPYCDWIGVTCNANKHQRVTQLNLFNLGLIATIPKEISHLSFLSTLNIRANSFHGHIPDTIGFLTKLQILDLSYNSLTGNIPATLYNVSSLRLVDLGTNHLSGTLPGDTFCDNFRLLRALNLSVNGLSGEIPSSLNKCMELRILDLGDNEFHGSIPPQIGNFSKLQQLILLRNNLTEQLVSMERCLVLVALMLSLCMASADDKAALLALKATITSDPFGVLSNWSHQTPYCDWIGVTCNANKHQRVTQLNLFNLGLIATIPKEISHLSFLSTLNIRANSFHGHIPDTIGFLTKLQILDLSYNSLTGNIPATLYNVSSLRLVDLGTNHLSGTLPGDTFCDNFRLLRALNLSVNGLSGEIPSSLNKCMELRILDLGDNEFHGSIPPQIGNFSKLQQLILLRNNLTVLNIADNEISGILPNDPCYLLPDVVNLNIATNRIHGEIPQALSTCRRLKALSLSGNQLSGRFPAQICNISSLQELYLVGMNLTGIIPNEIGELSILRRFIVFQNHLTGMIPSSIGNISTLEDFVVGDNNLQGNVPLELGKLSRLEGLSLRNNNFSGEIPSTIFNISTLQTIELTSNNLYGNLELALRHWISPSLESLLMDANQFTGTIPSSISNASQLTELELGNNMFSGHVPLEIENLQKLEHFHIQYNQFTNEPSSNELSLLTSLLKCKNLRTVSLSGNPFNTVLPNLLDLGNKSLPLEFLVAADCHLKGNIPSGICNFINLLVLELSDNKLSGPFPESIGRCLLRLQGLYISNTEIEGSIPNTMCYLKDLFELALRDNKLSGKIPSCFGNLYSLRKIYLGSNFFTSSIPLDFWNNKDVLEMDLSSNLLSGTLPYEIGSMHNLVYLNLSGNQFSGEIPNTIGQLQNLLNLSLSSNRLHGPIPQSFDSLISLQALDLSNNSLSGGIPKSMEKLKDLVYLNLSFNDLSGKIPNGGPFAKFSTESFMGNKKLCGASRFHVMECKEGKEKRRNTTIFRKYVLPSLVSVVVVVVVVLLVLLLTFRKRNKRRAPRVENVVDDVTLKRISYYEILGATEDFDESNLIGKGTFSSVFKGTFAAGLVLVVKVFNLDVQDSIKSFEVECQVLRNIRHRNLVKVITSCSNLDFKALILEYMPNGSLDKWLYSHNYFLDIYQRLGIMMDIANALEYLHHGHSFPVVHCDLKPGNILLDENMVVHVGDFGIAKLLDRDKATQQTKTMGTVGYMAPEYGSAGIVSTMGDVYSYGILLMEVFTRKKPTDEIFQGDFTMRRWVSDSLPDEIMQIVDSNLVTREEGVGQEIEECFLMVMGLAMECTSDVAEERIKMEDVIVRLRHALQKFNQNVSVNLVIN
ncbi:probable LRR receptor-like serine/threonine-protein kinase At3g47570 [Ipomoea triloba]|uniref:probable LRR receptor-like serine/threonine-protein kinase At3g47570 n=1 Tax=Ipomoea triloba TaxID=35885 RepID=UPI00125D670D|nr:probable LRR receptor-like serine/threonine-protein kinase At3g47570 [Ipomoea triloba]